MSAVSLVGSLAFLLGGVIAYVAGQRLDVTGLVPFAAGNFTYIGASDLIPEVKGHAKLSVSAIHFVAFVLGVVLLLAVKHLGHE